MPEHRRMPLPPPPALPRGPVRALRLDGLSLGRRGTARTDALPSTARALEAGAPQADKLDVGQLEAHRLEVPGNDAGEAPLERFHGYAVLGQVRLSAAAAAPLLALLGDRQAYDPYGEMARCFFPGLGVEVGEGAQAVAVLVCLECARVQFLRAGAQSWHCPSARTRHGLAAFHAALPGG